MLREFVDKLGMIVDFLRSAIQQTFPTPLFIMSLGKFI